MCRKIIQVSLLAICLGAQSVFAATSYQFQDVLNTPAIKSPLASKRLFNGVALAGKRLVAVGQLGTILFSEDFGKNWIQSSVPVSVDLTAVCFPTPKEGWAVGHDGIVLHTSDAGSSWEKQFDSRSAAKVMIEYYKANPPKGVPGGAEAEAQFQDDVGAFGMPDDQAPSRSFLDVYFENNNSGFIVGSFGLIFHTSDGGKTWQPWFDRRDDLMKHTHLYSIRSIAGNIFITGEQGLLMKLDRSVMRFRMIKTPYVGPYFEIVGGNGFMMAYGMRDNVYRSSDKGANWKKVDTGVITGFMGAGATPDGRVALASQDGYIFVSTPDGLSFNRVKMDQKLPVSAVALLDKDTIVLAGLGGLRIQKLK